MKILPGPGGAIADMDGDGQLELLLAHGESGAQELSLYHVTQGGGNHWLRVMPLTRNNAPARGAKVTVTLSDNTQLTRVVDGGSGYLCQMEPVAHFGLGSQRAERLRIEWPDGQTVHEQNLGYSDQDKLHKVVAPAPRSPAGGRGGGAQGPGYEVGQSSRTQGASGSANRGTSIGQPGTSNQTHRVLSDEL